MPGHSVHDIRYHQQQVAREQMAMQMHQQQMRHQQVLFFFKSI